MKVRAIRLREVGCFRDPVALEGLSGKLDVLAGPNEMGKSTLFKALRALFVIQHTANTAELRALRPHNGGNPLIEADFEIGERHLRLRKQFLGGKVAILQDLGNGNVLARGPDAEAQLAALLGRDEVQPGHFDLMWVRQKGTLAPTAIPLAARTALDAAIAAEVEVAAGGARARAIAQRVSADLKALVTEKQGRPVAGSDYHSAVKQRSQVAQTLEIAREEAARAADRFQRLADLRDQARVHNAPETGQALKQAAAEVTEQINKARRDRDTLRQVENELRTHEAEQKTAVDQCNAFEARLNRLTELENDGAQDAGVVEALAGKAREAEATRVQAHRQRDLAEADLTEATSAKVMLDQSALALEFARQRGQMQTALAEAGKVETSIAVLESERDPLSDSRMAALEREYAAIAVLEAAAVKIEVNYNPGAHGKIRYAGNALTSDVPLRASEPVTLDIEGVGTITVSPGEDDATDALGDLSAHRAVFADLLGEADAADIDEARTRKRTQQRREETLTEARTRLAALAPSGVAALTSALADLNANSPAAPANGVDADRAAVEARFAVAQGARAEAQKLAMAADAAQQEVNGKLHQRQAEATARRDTIADLATQLPAPDVREAHHSELTAARDHANTQVARSVVAQRALADVAVDDAAFSALEAKQRAAEQAGRDHARIGQRLTEDIRGLEGEVTAANENGSELRVQELQDQLAALERQIAGFKLRVESLTLIKEALEHAAQSTRDTFLAPVVDRMAPYFDTVFPDARLQFGDGLDVSALTRRDRSESLKTLSEGTQEQIAVLVRLGFGRLLADSGSPLPLILDDALVYSDDTRIERVFEALAAGATRHQVIVLTCRTRTFAPLAGHRLELSAWKNADAS